MLRKKNNMSFFSFTGLNVKCFENKIIYVRIILGKSDLDWKL